LLIASVKGLGLRGLKGRRRGSLNWGQGLNRCWRLGRRSGCLGGSRLDRRGDRLLAGLRRIGSLRSGWWLCGLRLRGWLLCSTGDRRIGGHLGKGRTSAPENRGLSTIWLAGPTRSLNHRRYLTLLGAWRATAPGLTVRSAAYTLRIR
jgi:hypothetical protein